ncbi:MULTISPECIES: primase C-terminal domain-containing protein [unclassified Enterococcus]|uniref:primase C-terminal domain-containing protein n=1 Tax=unclassified Enterococcus TaxID=2608891 RepID=UPI001555C4E5|nr:MULTISPECIES: primase C-terminal domain-containing protein [unclassified Enterococcus]MBS7576835.1 primase C-terminal domain-containing protein [Enterococcus sp. MMGLQ5-2]MBS7584242.1 primase C-terminal domain-containing protein [Enterococcus sp. MMGLQ5-1]NPD12098.1 hypothetical protein [Enterococcus sp. MMGLQ5-1]NPD36670.1 hypothetical protein [Enterococcus sp. MMGLQ5-2]
MIYIGKVSPSKIDEVIDIDVLTFFEEYEPFKVNIPKNEEQRSQLKRFKLNCFISGEMTELVRKNQNLISRDCLIIDLDDIFFKEKNELIQKIQKLFKNYDFVLYPTISNGFKGLRYRLVLPLRESVKAREYHLLVNYFSKVVLKSIIDKVDESNGTWSQAQGLPINDKSDIYIHKGLKRLESNKLIDIAKDWQVQTKGFSDDYNKTLSPTKRVFNKSYLNNMLIEIFQGSEEGGRNNRIAYLTKKFIKQGVKPSVMFEVAKVANSYFMPPLSEKEVKQTVESVTMTMLGVRE